MSLCNKINFLEELLDYLFLRNSVTFISEYSVINKPLANKFIGTIGNSLRISTFIWGYL